MRLVELDVAALGRHDIAAFNNFRDAAVDLQPNRRGVKPRRRHDLKKPQNQGCGRRGDDKPFVLE
ncbi:hypothetical protein V3H18_00405 [Methylocystis sp. 9N]|uniref:Uncharacterized protein n=1 Tax=Methylocystis borbori TaxID=3118750 RepID=A0ABU7XEJ4_9HYPH